jgi:hypothetical protein
MWHNRFAVSIPTYFTCPELASTVNGHPRALHSASHLFDVSSSFAASGAGVDFGCSFASSSFAAGSSAGGQCHAQQGGRFGLETLQLHGQGAE